MQYNIHIPPLFPSNYFLPPSFPPIHGVSIQSPVAKIKQLLSVVLRTKKKHRSQPFRVTRFCFVFLLYFSCVTSFISNKNERTTMSHQLGWLRDDDGVDISPFPLPILQKKRKNMLKDKQSRIFVFCIAITVFISSVGWRRCRLTPPPETCTISV